MPSTRAVESSPSAPAGSASKSVGTGTGIPSSRPAVADQGALSTTSGAIGDLSVRESRWAWRSSLCAARCPLCAWRPRGALAVLAGLALRVVAVDRGLAMPLGRRAALGLGCHATDRAGLGAHGGDAFVFGPDAARDRLGGALRQPPDIGAWIALLGVWSAGAAGAAGDVARASGRHG